MRNCACMGAAHGMPCDLALQTDRTGLDAASACRVLHALITAAPARRAARERLVRPPGQVCALILCPSRSAAHRVLGIMNMREQACQGADCLPRMHARMAAEVQQWDRDVCSEWRTAQAGARAEGAGRAAGEAGAALAAKERELGALENRVRPSRGAPIGSMRVSVAGGRAGTPEPPTRLGSRAGQYA